MVSKKKIQLPIVNHMIHTIEVQINDLLAKRVTIIQTPQGVTKRYTRPLSYLNIRRPEWLDAKNN